ncbi:class I SAM-dependent methyltransferase [Candidatus Omnitrophota bacterium]
MTFLSPVRRLLKTFHPEGIPWPFATVYNAISDTTIFQQHYEEIAKDIIQSCSKGSILDVGTGPGRLLVKLHDHSPELKITGLDMSGGMIRQAGKNLKQAGLSDSIDLHIGKAGELPYPDNAFKMVVSTGSMHHWKDPVACLNDIFRILRRGGSALIYDMVSDTPPYILKETAREFGKLKTLLMWIHAFEEPFYSTENFETIARSSLFQECSTRFVGVLFCLILTKKSSNT